MRIERNFGRPGWHSVFKVGDQHYFADLTYSMSTGAECMIFKSDSNGQFGFDDALGEYTNTECEFSEQGLRKCIDEFVEWLGGIRYYVFVGGKRANKYGLFKSQAEELASEYDGAIIEKVKDRGESDNN